MAKDLRYKDGAEFYGIVACIRKAVHIGCDDSLLGFMRIVPKRNKRVIVFYLNHEVETSNEET